VVGRDLIKWGTGSRDENRYYLTCYFCAFCCRTARAETSSDVFSRLFNFKGQLGTTMGYSPVLTIVPEPNNLI
jgi:hypothetical protein